MKYFLYNRKGTRMRKYVKIVLFIIALSLAIPTQTLAHHDNYNNDKNFAVANISTWHEAGYTGKGIKIVVVDRGLVQTNHPFFDGKVIDSNNDMTTTESVQTHAQSVVQIIHEIAPEAEIHLVEESFYDGMRYAITNEVHILSRSMTIWSEAMDNPINKEAYDKNIFLNGASGNSATSTSGSLLPYGKSNFWNTTGATGFHCEKLERAYYSSYGEGLDIMGMTANIVRKNLDNEHSISYFHGTSSATPFVTGMLALYYEHFFDLNDRYPTVEEARTYMYKNTVDMYEKGYDQYSGHGLFRLHDLNKKQEKLCEQITSKKNDKAVLMYNKKNELRYVYAPLVEEYIDSGYRLKCK